MLLEHYCNILTIPENDIMGAVTQLIMKYISGQTVPYLEYYEFFENSMLIGVPDFVPQAATEGDVTVLPAAFGLLNASLLNVSKVKTGEVTIVRLAQVGGELVVHAALGTAKTPETWEEAGWAPPAPQLPSIEVEFNYHADEFIKNVMAQHYIVTYGNNMELIENYCAINGLKLIK
jgi:L-fucose isomerase-like protein